MLGYRGVRLSTCTPSLVQCTGRALWVSATSRI